MIRSIFSDIKSSFDYGNMVTRLLIINVAVYIITALLQAFMPSFYGNSILPYIALPGDLTSLMYKPWTLITHMFLHNGLWHLIGNMITLHIFGNIVGDLLGDKRILPLYIVGGLMGALFYIISFQFLFGLGSMALGASAAALAIAFAAVATSPDYVIHLILIGPVRIKWIGLFFLFVDLIGTQKGGNTGGHLAHLGGTAFGFLFVYLLRQGIDLGNIFSFKKPTFTQKRNTNLKVVHRQTNIGSKRNNVDNDSGLSLEHKVDKILEKIKKVGYDNLTAEEKDILIQASKQNT